MLKIHTYTNTFYWPEVNTTILAEALSLMLSQTPTKWVKDLKVLQCSVRLIWVVVSEGIVGFSLSVTLETSHSSFMRRRRGYFQSHEAEHTHAICRQMMLGIPTIARQIEETPGVTLPEPLVPLYLISQSTCACSCMLLVSKQSQHDDTATRAQSPFRNEAGGKTYSARRCPTHSSGSVSRLSDLWV